MPYITRVFSFSLLIYGGAFPYFPWVICTIYKEGFSFFQVFPGIGGRRVGARRAAPAAAQDPPPGRWGRQRVLAAHGQLGWSRLASRPRKPPWLAAPVQLSPRWAGSSRWMTRAAGPPSRPSELGSLAASASRWPARLAQSASLVSTTDGGPGVKILLTYGGSYIPFWLPMDAYPLPVGRGPYAYSGAARGRGAQRA